MNSDPRSVLERLCVERGEDFAGLSRMLGRNPAYIQQFVRRGVPKRLKEEERRKLARYFSISETVLGGPPDEPRAIDGLISINRHPVFASAGPGGNRPRGLGQTLFRVRRALVEGPHCDALVLSVDRPCGRRFDVAHAERRGRHPGRSR